MSGTRKLSTQFVIEGRQPGRSNKPLEQPPFFVQKCTIVYMALHINDPEVTDLMNRYVKATGMSKTEALRRLLRTAVQQEEGADKKARFGAVARQIIEKNRKLNLKPFTKEEVDEIFE
ncbi:MAG: type II toxin-antitoxin system VapB family antitoxin [Bryobacteraceae bacterium]